MTEGVGEPMKLQGERTQGFEHHVWMDAATGIVSKIPSELGEVWQDMSTKAVERDLLIMEEFGIPTVSTQLFGPQMVSYSENSGDVANETRSQARYVLKQPLISPSHAMSFTDLFHHKTYRDQLLQLMEQGEGIKSKYGLGLDLLGGKGFELVGPALDPRITRMKAGVANLLVADRDIRTNGHWEKYSPNPGGFLAGKGEALLCDTRLMPIGEGKSWRDRILAPLMRKNREFQDAALWALLEKMDVNLAIVRMRDRFDTSFKRFVRRLTHHAIPKMTAEAEACG